MSAHSAPPSPTLNPFVTPQPLPRILSVTPRHMDTPVRPLPSYQPPLSPLRLLSPLPCPLSLTREKVVNVQPLLYPPPVLWTPSPSVSASSVDLSPQQHLCLVRRLKHLNHWLAQGWEPGVDKSRLWALAEVFNSAESVAEGSLSNIRQADLVWRLANSEGWEKSAGSSIMGAIDIQVAVTKILYRDYGESLIVSFRSFLGQKQTELGNSGSPTCLSGLLRAH